MTTPLNQRSRASRVEAPDSRGARESGIVQSCGGCNFSFADNAFTAAHRIGGTDLVEVVIVPVGIGLEFTLGNGDAPVGPEAAFRVHDHPQSS